MTATNTTDSAEPAAAHDFFSKDIPEPYQILGLKLLPLSIGRYRRMARYGIGFVSESQAQATGKDLLLGLLICSMSCRAWDALSATDKVPKLIKAWMQQISCAPPFYLRGKIGRIISLTWLGRRWRARHSFNLFQKCQLFKSYLEEAQEFPRFMVRQQSDRSSVSHWSHNIEVVLRGELGWTREEIEERPLSGAIADYFKLMENQGLITILTEADYQQIANNDAEIKKALEEWEKKGGK